MSTLSLSELKRLTPPLDTNVDEAEAELFWVERPVEERKQAMMQVLREFYRERGLDIDKPMEKTIKISTFEEKNREHEEWASRFRQVSHEPIVVECSPQTSHFPRLIELN